MNYTKICKFSRGGEAVYRNGEYVGIVTNAAFGFTLDKLCCLGFVQHPDTINGNPTILKEDWIADKSAKWAINIAGKMVSDFNAQSPCYNLHISSSRLDPSYCSYPTT